MKTGVECSYLEVPAEAKSESDETGRVCLARTNEAREACCAAAVASLGNLTMTLAVVDYDGLGIAGVAAVGRRFGL